MLGGSQLIDGESADKWSPEAAQPLKRPVGACDLDHGQPNCASLAEQRRRSLSGSIARALNPAPEASRHV
jgi:hypothetical protein